MGLFYNIVSPFVGGRQPLEQRKLAPPQSGPAPENPPFTGARIPAAVMIAWAAPAAAVVLPHLLPPQAAAQPPPRRLPDAIFQAWDAKAPAIQRSARLIISGPTPEAPPINGGAKLPLPVQIWWIPPPPEPQTAILLSPPISGPVPQDPPIVGARVPAAVSIAWIPPPPQPQSSILLRPPIPAPDNPPIVGARQPLAVQIAWIPPPPDPQSAILLSPPIPAPDSPIGRPGIPPGVMAWWNAPPVYITLELNPAPEVAPDSPPGRGSIQAILDAWRAAAPALQRGSQFAPLIPAAVVQEFVFGRRLDVSGWLGPAWASQRAPQIAPLLPEQAFVFARRLAIDWPAPPHPFLAQTKIVQGAAAPVAPPTGLGGRLPQGTLTWFIPPPPMPQWTRHLEPPISGPTPDNPPLRRPLDHRWPAETTFPAQPRRFLIHIAQPPPRPGLEAILSSWIAADPRVQARRLLPILAAEPLPIGARIPASVFAWWDRAPFVLPPRARLVFDGAVGPPPLVRVTSVLDAWQVRGPAPALRRLIIPQSGPTPDNPPPLVRMAYLLDWPVPAPWPFLVRPVVPSGGIPGQPVLYAVSTVVQWESRSTLVQWSARSDHSRG